MLANSALAYFLQSATRGSRDRLPSFPDSTSVGHPAQLRYDIGRLMATHGLSTSFVDSDNVLKRLLTFHTNNIAYVPSGLTITRDLKRNVAQSLPAACAYLDRQPGRFHVAIAGSTQVSLAQVVPLVLHWSRFGGPQYMIIDCVEVSRFQSDEDILETVRGTLRRFNIQTRVHTLVTDRIDILHLTINGDTRDFVNSVLGLDVILEATLKAILSVYSPPAHVDPTSYWDMRHQHYAEQAAEHYPFEDRHSALPNLLPRLFCLCHHLELNPELSALFLAACRQKGVFWFSPGNLTQVTSVITLVITISKCQSAIQKACRDVTAASFPSSLALTADEWVCVNELALILEGFQAVYHYLARQKYVLLDETVPILDALVAGLEGVVRGDRMARDNIRNAAARGRYLLEEHFGDTGPDRVAGAACVLNPSYKLKHGMIGMWAAPRRENILKLVQTMFNRAFPAELASTSSSSEGSSPGQGSSRPPLRSSYSSPCQGSSRSSPRPSLSRQGSARSSLRPPLSRRGSSQRQRRSDRLSAQGSSSSATSIQRRSSHRSTVSRPAESLYEPRTFIYKLDKAHWEVPKGEVGIFFSQPVADVDNPLEHWDSQGPESELGNLATVAVTVLSIPASTLLGPFPFRDPVSSVDLADTANSSSIIFRDWLRHSFISEVALVNDIEGEDSDDGIVELDTPPAASESLEFPDTDDDDDSYACHSESESVEL